MPLWRAYARLLVPCMMFALAGCENQERAIARQLAAVPMPEVPPSERLVMTQDGRREFMKRCLSSAEQKGASRSYSMAACRCAADMLPTYVRFAEIGTTDKLTLVAARCAVATFDKPF